MELKGWVSQAVGIYAILGSIFFVVLIIVAGYMLVLLADLSRQLKALTGKIQTLTERVHNIAANVENVTNDVGVRAKGIVRLVDDQTSNALKILEYVTPILLIFGAVSKIRRGSRSRSRR